MVGVDVATQINFQDVKGSQVHDYIWKCFGPDSTENMQIWWIQNCATCGAPDEIIRGEELHLNTDPLDKILRLLK